MLSKNIVLPGYEIIEKLGQGGMGIVYKAIDLKVKRTVALKILHDTGTSVKRFQREARILAYLKHPNILQIYNAGEYKGILYFSMEYIEGVTIDAYIKQYNLSQHEILELFKTICLTFNFAHSKGVIHRDIKPSNIMVTAERKIYLLDFGISKLSKLDYNLTKTNEVIGTIAYMSPEQVEGKNRQLTKQSDIYSLGVLLHVLMTNSLPYMGETNINISFQIASGNLVLSETLPTKLKPILQKTLSKKPQDRYNTAQQLKNDIDRFTVNKYIWPTFFSKKRIQQISIFILIIIVFTCAFLYRNVFFAPNKQEIESAIQNNYSQIKLVENLVELGFYEEAQQTINQITKENLQYKKELHNLQIQLWDGQNQYFNVWNDSEKIFLKPEVAVLKIKAAYHLKIDIENNAEIEIFKNQARRNEVSNQQLIFYELLHMYYQKDYSKPHIRYLDFLHKYKTLQEQALSSLQKIELYLCLANCYLEQKKSQEAVTFFQQVIALQNNNYKAHVGIAKSFLLQNKISEAQDYLKKSCELRPDDDIAMTMLAKTYIGTKPHLAYDYFRKALAIGKNPTEPLNSMLDLALQDVHYQNQVFSLLITEINENKVTPLPDLLREEVSYIRESFFPYYLEFIQKNESIDIGKWCERLKDQTTQDMATKTLIAAGYSEEILEQTKHLQNDRELWQKLQKIQEKVASNHKNLFYYALAEFYLHNNNVFHIVKDYKNKLNMMLLDNQENILYRYLAAKTLAKLHSFSEIIKELNTKNHDLLIIVNCVLAENGFTFFSDTITHTKLFLSTRVHSILYAKALYFRHENSIDYFSDYNDLIISYSSAIVENLQKGIDSSDEIIQLSCACIFWYLQGEKSGETLNKLENILKKATNKTGAIQEYAYYFYWEGSYIIADISKYTESSEEFIRQLNQEKVPQSIKNILLDKDYWLRGGDTKRIFQMVPSYKDRLVEALLYLSQKKTYNITNLKASVSIAKLVPYQPPFYQIMYNSSLPSLYKIIAYNLSMVNAIKNISFQDWKSLQSTEISNFSQNARKCFGEIMEKEKSNVFKFLVYKSSALMGLQSLKFIDHPNCTDANLQANILTSIASLSIVPKEYKYFITLLIRNVSDYKDLEQKELMDIVERFTKSPHSQVRMSAWAMKIFLTRDIEPLVLNSKKQDDVIRSGVAWGIYNKITSEVTENLSMDVLSYIGYMDYNTMYNKSLRETVTDQKVIKRYVKWLSYAIAIEIDEAMKSLYTADLAFMHYRLGEIETAIKTIEKTIPNTSNELLRAEILLFLSPEESYQIMEKHHMLMDYYQTVVWIQLLENHLHLQTDEKWKKVQGLLYQKLLTLLFEKIRIMGGNGEKSFSELEAIYPRIIKYYSEDQGIRNFYINCQNVLAKKLKK